MGIDATPPLPLLEIVARQLEIDPNEWNNYAERGQTRREHLIELQTIFGFKSFTTKHYKPVVYGLEELAWQTDKGMILAKSLIENLRNKLILLPPVDVFERICAEAIAKSYKKSYQILTDSLTEEQKMQLDALLLQQESGKISKLAWLRQSPGAPNAKHMLEHIERLHAISDLTLSEGLEHLIHKNRLLKLAREGAQMTAQHLRDLENMRRHATVMALILETKATIIDEIIDLHDRILSMLFNRAKSKHLEQFQDSGKEIHAKVRLYCRIGNALLDAKKNNSDPFAAIEKVLPWSDFIQSVEEAHKCMQSENFDYLHLIGDSYSQIRRCAPEFLNALHLKAAPAAKEILHAVEILKKLNLENIRHVPKNAPISFN